MQRPINHVTRQAPPAAFRTEEWPEVPEALVAYLEQAYPAQCYRAGEDLEQHLMLSGQVELIQTLRSITDAQRITGSDPDGDEQGATSLILNHEED